MNEPVKCKDWAVGYKHVRAGGPMAEYLRLENRAKLAGGTPSSDILPVIDDPDAGAMGITVGPDGEVLNGFTVGKLCDCCSDG